MYNIYIYYIYIYCIYIYIWIYIHIYIYIRIYIYKSIYIYIRLDVHRLHRWTSNFNLYIYTYIYIYIYIYINYRESASRFSCGTVRNMLKQSGINILRGKKDFFPLKINIYISFFNLVFFEWLDMYFFLQHLCRSFKIWKVVKFHFRIALKTVYMTWKIK